MKLLQWIVYYIVIKVNIRYNESHVNELYVIIAHFCYIYQVLNLIYLLNKS